MAKVLVNGVLDYLEFGLIDSNNSLINSSYIKLNKNLADELISQFNSFLNNNNLKKEGIKEIYVINGPGSFTSLKIISVFFNTYKLINKNIKLFSISTNKFFATEVDEHVLIDAKTKLFYYYNKNLTETQIISEDEISKINKNHIYMYETTNKKDLNLCWEANKNNFAMVDKISPFYLKKPL